MGEEEILTELFSELGPNDAVDEQVSRGVDHEEHMGYKSDKNTPNGKSPKKGIFAQFNGIEDKDLMHVEEQLREIAEDECGDNHDEDDREMFIFFSPPISSPSNSKVYLDIEEGDGCEREDTNDHQA